MSDISLKVVVNFVAREDGGLRAYSDDVPGLVLSSDDVDGLITDIPVALEKMLSFTLQAKVTVTPLSDFSAVKKSLVDCKILPPISHAPGPKEFVAFMH